MKATVLDTTNSPLPAPQAQGIAFREDGLMALRSHEFGPVTPFPNGVAIIDGDGNVGILDLLALLTSWATDLGGPPDFDGDGIVGILDLLTLLASWGQCA